MTTPDGSFAGFLCWDPTDVDGAVPWDAASPSDALFLATHHPMRLTRLPLRSLEGGQLITEEDFLQDFLSEGAGLVFAEMTDVEKNLVSHRARAFNALVEALRSA